MAVSIDDLDDLVQRSDRLVEHLKKHIFSPDGHKRFNKIYKIGEASTMIGRHPTTVREAENQGAIEAERADGSNARGFTLSEINKARRYYNTMPQIGADESPAILAVQNFKGGVGKTSIAVHLAQWMAIRGFRT